MGSNNSKRSSIPITVSHPRLNSYYDEFTDENRQYISTVAMALNDSSTNLQNTSSSRDQQQQQNRPKMVVKSSQTSPMNRSVPQNLNTTGSNMNNSSKNTPSGVYSVAKQHQSLQVKPRMGRSSLALDDNSNFLLGSNQNLRKPSMDSGSSENSDDLNNNPRRNSPLDKEPISYTPPADEFIKIPAKMLLDDHIHDDDSEDEDLELQDNHQNASKLIKSPKSKQTPESKRKKLKSSKSKDSKISEKKLAKEMKRKEAEAQKMLEKEEKNKAKLKRKSKKDLDAKMRRGRSSACVSVVFFFEICSIIGLGLFAALLQFTATFDIVPQMFSCGDSELSKNLTTDNSKMFFSNIPELWIQGACLAVPLALIFVLEFFRGIIGFLLLRPNYESKVRTLGIPIAPGVRRFFRFVGGYLIGFFVLSILCDALKQQTGILRPTFLHTCRQLEHFCATNGTNSSSPSLPVTLSSAHSSPPSPIGGERLFSTANVSSLCFETEFPYTRTRFPSTTSAFATYAAGFCLLYLCFALQYRGLRFLRIWAILALLLTYMFIMNVQLQSIAQLPVDSFVGAVLGAIILVLIVFFHLNAFATKISNSNFFDSSRCSTSGGNDLETGSQRRRICGGGSGNKSASGSSSEAELEMDNLSHVSSTGMDRDREWFWKSFHIPRVHTLRQSARALWRKTGYRPGFGSSQGSGSRATSPQASTLPARKAAYINPAFSTRDSDYLSAETGFSTAGRGTNDGYSASANNVRKC